MATGYIAEVDTVDGTKYVGHGGALKKVPQFFLNPVALRDILVQDNGKEKYGYTLDRFKTRVIIVDNLEAGLRACSAKPLNVFQFEELPIFNRKPLAYKAYPNAVFKIELFNKGKNGKPMFAGPGKFGKTWGRAGDLRSHLRLDLNRLMGEYNGAQVVEIIIGEDGCTTTRVSKMPVLEFYKGGTKEAQTELKQFIFDTDELRISDRIDNIGNRPL